MNDVAKKLVEENHNLIYAYCHKYNLAIEEYYDILAIGLCKAAMSYDREFRNEFIEFSTYAYKCMSNEVYRQWRYISAKSRIPNNLIGSLDFETNKSEDGGKLRLMDSIADEKQEEEINKSELMLDIANAYEKMKPKLNDVWLEIFRLHLDGVNQYEIGRKLGYSQAQVSRVIKKIQKEFRKELG